MGCGRHPSGLHRRRERPPSENFSGNIDLGECTDEMLARYSKINRTYWVKLENGEMTKPEILVGRFRDFFVVRGPGCLPSPQHSMKNTRTGSGMRTPSFTATTA